MRCETPPLLSDRRCAPSGARGLARERPVIVILDDLHWADAHLLELLHATRANPWSGPVLLLGLSRLEALGSGDPLPTLKPALPDRRLRSAASWHWVRSPGLGPGTDRHPSLREPIVLRGESEHAGGVGRPSATARRLDHLRPPPPVRRHHPHLIAARLDGLPADEARAAGRAQEATWDRLLDGVSAAGAVRSALQRLVDRDLLRRRPRSRQGAREYVFKHVLIRDVAYESLPGETGVGCIFASRPGLRENAGLPEEPLAELAYHYEEARVSAARAAGTVDQDLDQARGRVPRPLGGQDVYLSDPVGGVAVREGHQRRDSIRGGVDLRLLTRLSWLGRAESLIELGRHRGGRPGQRCAEPRDPDR